MCRRLPPPTAREQANRMTRWLLYWAVETPLISGVKDRRWCWTALAWDTWRRGERQGVILDKRSQLSAKNQTDLMPNNVSCKRWDTPDLDWHAGRLCIPPGKTHRARLLPLSGDVGQALATYLVHGRPTSTSRIVFLTWRPPFQPLAGASAISRVARRAMVQHSGTTTAGGAYIPSYCRFADGESGCQFQGCRRCAGTPVPPDHRDLCQAGP